MSPNVGNVAAMTAAFALVSPQPRRGGAMSQLFMFFNGPIAPVMASVVAFVSFFLIARVAHARQGIAFAFAFTPLLLFFAVEAASAGLS
jgi:hypothetical protein